MLDLYARHTQYNLSLVISHLVFLNLSVHIPGQYLTTNNGCILSNPYLLTIHHS